MSSFYQKLTFFEIFAKILEFIRYFNNNLNNSIKSTTLPNTLFLCPKKGYFNPEGN
jgi:hypothetical protein